jgi:hypothetical protein
MRRPAAPTKPRKAQSKSFAAPVAGWIANQNLADPVDGAPQGAVVLENILPTATGGEVRRGSDVFASMTDTTKPVDRLFSYKNGNLQSFFATNETTITDITGTPADKVTDLTGGNWVFVPFTNDNGQIFLRGVNGMDTPLVYDGANFSTTPAITFPTGVTVTPDQLYYVWAFKNRLFFIQKESMDVWYLSVNQMGGELVQFPMGSIFSRGGQLLFGASWSVDAGNGLSENCVFVSSEGEVAVYSGSNPGDATDFQKVGVYRIGKPLGQTAFIRAGGDLVIATQVGFVPLSQAIQRDYAALSPSAISYSIETAWNQAVADRPGEWSCEVWPERQAVFIALPATESDPAAMYVANSRTGAWAPFTGWQATCVLTFNGRLFWGTADGKIVEGYIGGLDRGMPYTATYVPQFDDFGLPTNMKIGLMARAVIRSAVPVTPKLFTQADFIIDAPIPPDAAIVPAGNQWASAVWGASVWGAGSVKQIQQDWVSVAGSGYALVPGIQITSGAAVPLDTEIVRLDMTFDITDITG